MWLKRIAAFGLLFCLLYGLGFVLETYLIEYALRIVLLCGISAIVAVGLNFISGTTGQFSLGHAGFMAAGAYMTALCLISLEDAFFPGRGGALNPLEVALVLVPSLTAGGLFAGFLGFCVGVPSLRLKGDYLAIVTLGFGEIIRLVFNNASALGGATGYSGGRSLGLPVYTSFFWVMSTAILTITLIGNLTYSSYGRALRAIRHDEIAAEASGLATTRLKVMAFVLSAALAGVGGGLFAHLQSTIRPDDFKFDRSTDLLVMVIVGGLGSVTGAVVGAVFVSVTLELTRDLAQYRLVVYALLLIILMLYRPTGMLGQREWAPLNLLARMRQKKASAP